MLTLATSGCGKGGNGVGLSFGDDRPPRSASQVLSISGYSSTAVSPLQRDALADMIVTVGEYKQATLATVACLRGAGIKTTDPALANDGRFTFQYSVPIPADDAREAVNTATQATFERCYQAHQKYAELVYLERNLLTKAQKKRLLPDYQDCLRSAGVKIDAEASLRETLTAVTEQREGSTAGEDPAILSCNTEFEGLLTSRPP